MMDQDTKEMLVGDTSSVDLDVAMGDQAVLNVNPSSLLAPKPSYTPQFPSESSAILNRLKSGPQVVNDHNVGGNPGADLKGTLTMPTPTKAQGQFSPSHSLNAGVKRKREGPPEKVDLTQSTIPFPWNGPSPTLQAGLDSRRSGQEFRCSRCGESAQIRPLVTCIYCLAPWHQQCHSPLIRDEDMVSANFTCAACTTGREQTLKLRGRVSQQRQHEIDRLRQKRLSSLPRGIVPAKSHLVGFGAGRASDTSRAEYFDSMSRTDLLNILSLCDQLKPNLLVDVLVSVSKRHPEMPIFDSPDWDSQLLNTSRPSKGSKHDERSRHGHVLLNKAAKPKQKTTKKILKRTRVIEVVTSTPEEDNVDILPPTWAKAGQGLYSKLLPETEDRLLLMDENDEESFSHFLVDGVGRQIMEPVGA